mmetsp:Transcript_59989/g.69469  ORF Transcript_59989/g.69469 Transcript_59989/m.69469 type:complete len:359 (-) Transcript_59989:304-1380(-)
MADECKQKGNAAFSEKRYEDAIRFYDEGIAIDASMIDLYNNRSAANFELGRFEDAAEDAKRGLKVSTSSKGHMRLGNAYWRMGRLELARNAYELALSCAPGNQTIRDNLTQIRNLLAAKDKPTSSFGGSTTTASTGGSSDSRVILANAAVLVLAVAHVLGLFILGPSIAMIAWRLCLAVFAGRQFLAMVSAGLVKMNKETLSRWLTHFSAQYFVLCAAGAVLGIPPLHLLLASMVMYTVIDLATSQAALRATVPPQLMDRLVPYLNKAQQHRDQLIGNAATCEAMLTFMLFFSGASIMFNILYVQFVKFRYRSDPFPRMAFTALRQTVERLTRHRLCPPLVDRMFGKFCDLVHKVGSG